MRLMITLQRENNQIDPRRLIARLTDLLKAWGWTARIERVEER